MFKPMILLVLVALAAGIFAMPPQLYDHGLYGTNPSWYPYGILASDRAPDSPNAAGRNWFNLHAFPYNFYNYNAVPYLGPQPAPAPAPAPAPSTGRR